MDGDKRGKINDPTKADSQSRALFTDVTSRELP